MKLEITQNKFVDLMEDDFSYRAKIVIFDYLEETNPEGDFDRVAIRSGFAEYCEGDDLETMIYDYQIDIGLDGSDDLLSQILDHLRNEGLLISEDPIVISQ